MLSAMLSRPPSPPLFPYTTLFRSERRCGTEPSSGGMCRHGSSMLCHPKHLQRHQACECHDVNCGSGVAPQMDEGRQIGRAHVCSSHANISYAVFCLKKKKRNDDLS